MCIGESVVFIVVRGVMIYEHMSIYNSKFRNFGMSKSISNFSKLLQVFWSFEFRNFEEFREISNNFE